MWGEVNARESSPEATSAARARVEVPDFREVYEKHVTSLWRGARALGIPEHAVEDVLQDVFVVVHRRLPEFEGRAALRTWLMKILVRVVATHRRRHRRKGGHDELPDVPDEREAGPHEHAARREHRSQHVLLLREFAGVDLPWQHQFEALRQASRAGRTGSAKARQRKDAHAQPHTPFHRLNHDLPPLIAAPLVGHTTG